MLGKALETLFIRVWVVVKLTLFFWLFSLTGGIVLGIGPALKTINELFYHYEFEYKDITLKQGWYCFKKYFKRGNYLFFFFFAGLAILSYNLYLSVQIQGLLFLGIDFILLFGLLYLFATYQWSLILDSEYEMTFGNVVKLSFISSLSSFSTLLKMIIGSGIILALTWHFKGLLLFGLLGLLTVWNVLATKKWREELAVRMENYE
ncbi:hypothetical protein IGJ66_002250 [Enterococcus sp. DIV0176]|uniref:DUF624 domain-containing protein n=1 Tax=Enterococcus sp. DIV0176 TaxID=2774758 RepID=UPI003D2FE86F